MTRTPPQIWLFRALQGWSYDLKAAVMHDTSTWQVELAPSSPIWDVLNCFFGLGQNGIDADKR